jgi:hypothetical protein
VSKIPDVAEPPLAFRVWAWDRHLPTTLWSLNAKPLKRNGARGQLRATARHARGAWPTDKPLIARYTKRGKDGKPLRRPSDKDCACGVYSANSIEVVAGYLQEAPVLGLVRGLGTVVPAEFGFRAEGVRIAALFDIDLRVHNPAPRPGAPRPRLQCPAAAADLSRARRLPFRRPVQLRRRVAGG